MLTLKFQETCHQIVEGPACPVEHLALRDKLEDSLLLASLQLLPANAILRCPKNIHARAVCTRSHEAEAFQDVTSENEVTRVGDGI